ncbi:hypothetical protein M406DRAFT_68207 [Cryphonectria parasitica EP155]|uniref:RING-type domain-containing protein n=1 Tax=Cryphonectria parasitica (strain ATCC 38755 / EP155) TaxID=660469 RepID=A0A9P5CQ26_CRYP1|nr:uncharacterized protein M406DRAFT_68207 [Cryphonectria parasitica EP155]KAF3765801.1 hypothetical protein M406DRAFT_68207 [Cryphonectria parasitica EP155]
MGWHRASALALAFASALSMVCADLAQTYPMSTPLDWEVASEMQLSVSAADEDVVPLIYTVIPLTTDLGLNESQTDRGRINIQGKLTYADATTYTDISGADVIPYLCCDQMNNSFIQPNEILNQLMSNDPQPAAILLYSQQDQCCGLAGQNLNYQKILTTPDLTTASQVENITMLGGGAALAAIAGNFTNNVEESSSNGNNSAVAMSILYSITGLITLLFLIIIGSGAIRAHRYPERYGPRAGFGGRSRQSRAKGLARAVLETLPIVKFGDNQQQQPKPDFDTELESATVPAQEPRQRTADASHEAPPRNESQRHLSTIPESPTTEAAASGTEPPTNGLRTVGSGASTTSVGKGTSGSGGDANKANAGAGIGEEGLGCSICTDDFNVGEDVRVLPCNHKFHPQCVDPWLVNVSGTCPLW